MGQDLGTDQITGAERKSARSRFVFTRSGGGGQKALRHCPKKDTRSARDCVIIHTNVRMGGKAAAYGNMQTEEKE